jgi:hypothetical protein
MLFNLLLLQCFSVLHMYYLRRDLSHGREDEVVIYIKFHLDLVPSPPPPPPRPIRQKASYNIHSVNMGPRS